MNTYIDVIVPLPLYNTFTYQLTDEMVGKVKVGVRVIVPFGARKYYTGIVLAIHSNAPTGFKIKSASELLDEEPIVLPYQLEFWKFIADYYICSLGEVYKAALPSGLKLESETKVVCNYDALAENSLSDEEQYIVDLFEKKKDYSLTQLRGKCLDNGSLKMVKHLLEKQILILKESIVSSYKPRVEARISLFNGYNERRLHLLLDTLSKNQKKLLEAFLDLTYFSSSVDKEEDVSRKKLLSAANFSSAASTLRILIKNKIFEQHEVELGRLSCVANEQVEQLYELNESQRKAYYNIKDSFLEKNVCLLYGVTSSGKTEVYIHLIQHYLNSGKQVLYLLPEIALTTQITTRLKRVFGNRVGIYHSKFPDAERVEIWKKQLSEDSYDVILGVRSSIFLPFKRLGLVIVDEEHEACYKQQDPAPRYNARDAAIVLASKFKAKTLLGTATPSMESYANAVGKKFGWVKLLERHKNIAMPAIVPVDVKELKRKKRMIDFFSPYLLEQITQALAQKEQVILFQNRRGYSSMLECKVCGWVPRCQFCDVSLTYHKRSNRLVCHYCGASFAVPKQCPNCEEQNFFSKGVGTEMIEDKIKTYFPNARVARMDLDTTQKQNAYEKMITSFEQGEVDILIGTQMVSKGLDFENVNLVGILNADSMLNFPDFRAYERSFQLMSQVAGRAGRNHGQGHVVLQTKSIDHPIIAQVMSNDFIGMIQSQLLERQMFYYPPYCRVIYVYLKLKNDELLLDNLSQLMSTKLSQVDGLKVIGPGTPPIGKIKNYFIRQIILKINLKCSVSQIRAELKRIQNEMLSDSASKQLIVYYDVDPV